jgi:hypothetical protein
VTGEYIRSGEFEHVVVGDVVLELDADLEGPILRRPAPGYFAAAFDGLEMPLRFEADQHFLTFVKRRFYQEAQAGLRDIENGRSQVGTEVE